MLKLFIEQLKKMLPHYVSRQVDIKNENIRLDVSTRGLIPVLRFLRDHSLTQCKQLIEIAAVDMPKNAKYRFSVNYLLYSPRFSSRLIINTQVNELVPIPTSTVLFQSANWLEREVWDLFGIFFSGHSDLRRILTDYNFQGHPMRKDFPLTGFTSLMFSDLKSRIVYSKVKLGQEFRTFNLSQQVTRGMSYKTNPRANRYAISVGTLQNMVKNFNMYTVKYQAFLLAYLSTQALLASKKIALLKLWYAKNYVINQLQYETSPQQRAALPLLRINRSRYRGRYIRPAAKKRIPGSRSKLRVGSIHIKYKDSAVKAQYSALRAGRKVTYAFALDQN